MRCAHPHNPIKKAREIIHQHAICFVRISRDDYFHIVSDFPKKVLPNTPIFRELSAYFDTELSDGLAHMRLNDAAILHFMHILLDFDRPEDISHLPLETAALADRLIHYPYAGYSPEHHNLIRKVAVWDDRFKSPDTDYLRQNLALSLRKKHPGDALRAVGHWLCR